MAKRRKKRATKRNGRKKTVRVKGHTRRKARKRR